jgi:hypothetical protein
VPGGRQSRLQLVAAPAPSGSRNLAIVASWFREHHRDGDPLKLDGEPWYGAFERLRPPAIARATILLIAHHVETRLSVSLAPPVAEVYLRDPDTYPIDGCAGCGYPLPTRARLRPDDTFEYLDGVYLGECPVCGLDNHPEDA